MPSRSLTRSDFSIAVIRAVRDRAGNKCSQPQCRAETVGADRSSYDGVTIVGEAAHIRAAAPGGPRYDSTQTVLERSSIQNAIWLCAKCATLIDKNEGRSFSVAKLLRWKQAAERNSNAALAFSSSLVRPDWLDRIHYAQFINVPRLASVLGGLGNFGLDEKKGFRGQGANVAPISLHIEEALAASAIEAIPLDDITPPSDDVVGQTISFDHRCYTKNGVDADTTANPRLLSNFDPKKSPHFYIKLGKVKAIFPYDPAWITTSTAYCDFRSGHTRFAGLGVVKRVDEKQESVIISALVVTLPSTPSMMTFYDAWN